MTIRSRMGLVIKELVKLATEDDIRRIENDEPNHREKELLETNSLIVAIGEDGKERIHHIGSIVANNPYNEIYSIYDKWIIEKRKKENP